MAHLEKEPRSIHWNMSAEAETGPQEGKKGENGDYPGSSRVSYVKNNWSIGLKILELVT